MEVHFTPEPEARHTHAAAQQGRNPDELAQEILARCFEEEARFVRSRDPRRGRIGARRVSDT